jgi:hypothetical protein
MLDGDVSRFLLRFANGDVLDYRTGVVRPCVAADRISLGTDSNFEPWQSDNKTLVGTLLLDLNKFWQGGGQSVYNTPFEERLNHLKDRKPDLYWCIYHLFENHDTALWMVRQLSRGCCSTGQLEEFLFLHDSRGVNGKGTILALLMATLGIKKENYYKSVDLDDLSVSRGGGNTPHLADCRGRRAVICNEAFHSEQRSVVLNPTNIKKLVSLDDPVATMAKYRDPESWKPQCLLIICTNSAPKFPADDGGCETRLAFLNMPFKFTTDPANDSERAADSDVKLVHMPACVPEFLFWGPLLVQGMLGQSMGRHLVPRPAQIAADTRAAFCVNSPTDIPDLAKQFCNVHLMTWRKELGKPPSSRVEINSHFEKTHPAYKASVVLPRDLVSKKGNTVFSMNYNGAKIGVYRQLVSDLFVTVTLRPVVAQQIEEEEQDEVGPAAVDEVAVGPAAVDEVAVGTGLANARGLAVARSSSTERNRSSSSERKKSSSSSQSQ